MGTLPVIGTVCEAETKLSGKRTPVYYANFVKLKAQTGAGEVTNSAITE